MQAVEHENASIYDVNTLLINCPFVGFEASVARMQTPFQEKPVGRKMHTRSGIRCRIVLG